MRRVFIDSSVLFAAAYSANGHSRDLLNLGAIKKIKIVISGLVIRETERNIEEFDPEKLPILTKILDSVDAEIIEVTANQVKDAAKYITFKDAPILAAAKASQADMLVTLDKKHFLNRPELSKYAGMPIITLKETMERFKGP
jgi:predicted nucleic acid-binding protein